MLVDLSHTIEHGLVTYAGLPAPVVSEFLTRDASRQRYAAGTEFRISRIEMVGNTGTYVDAPSHRFDGDRDISDIDLEAIADVPAIVLRATNTGAIDRVPANLAGKALLIHTGWSRHWRSETYW